MSTFQLSFSSPPTTPEQKWRPPKATLGSLRFDDMNNDPSTTPAGPPPQSAASFTPDGPPPSSVFGSSQFGTDVSKLRFSKQTPLPGSLQGLRWQPGRAGDVTPRRTLSRNTFQVPSSSILSDGSSFDRSRSHLSEDRSGDEVGFNFEDSMQMDQSTGPDDRTGLSDFIATETRSGLQSSLLDNQSHLSTRSRLRQSKPIQRRGIMSHQLPRKGNPHIIPNLAQDLASRREPAVLTEPDEMVLKTEKMLAELYDDLQNAPYDDLDTLQGGLAALKLMRFWNSCAPPEQNLGEGIGPGTDASPLQKGIYLASLLLSVRHPPLLNAGPNETNGMTESRSPSAHPRPIPTPKILIDWLNCYHLSYTDLFDVVRSAPPNCTAHEQFWDVAFGMLVRGQTSQVLRLFAHTDFQHAVSALDEGREEPGYHGAQLQAVQAAISRASEVLRICPATRGDWQLGSSDWDLFRKRVSSELEELAASGGPSGLDDSTSAPFQAENFGLPKADPLLPRFAQNSQRKLPWTIHQNLKIFYGIMLGSADEIIAQSQDWLEATAALTIWWDGSEESDITRWSLNVSQAQRADVLPDAGDLYLGRLRAAFLCVTDPESPDSFQINPHSDVEVGLASILQGNVEGVLSSLWTHSLVITSAVAELASAAGWLKPAQAGDVPSSLDQDDLIVLNYGAQTQRFTRDGILLQYAQQLYDREEFVDDEDGCEGWELAIAVASRIHDRQLAAETTTNFLDQMRLDSQNRLDKLLALCSSLGLEAEARTVSERFADHLSANTTLYGPALVCYARSHAAAKIRQLIDFLISYSLVRSAAYPPSSQLDDELRALVENPKRPLAKLHQIDAEAAAMLQFYLAGYACLRRFYRLRDEEMTSQPGKADRAGGAQKLAMKPLARKRAAAQALVAVINSSADSIYGGLYDAERESAIQVDGLLTLLGEVTALVAEQQPTPQPRPQDQRVLTPTQIYDILAAIEDIQTVNQRVFDAAEDCLVAALKSYDNPSSVPSARTLKKSVSAVGSANNETSNLSFSMMGSDLLMNSEAGSRSQSRTRSAGRSVGGSGVLVQANDDDDLKIDVDLDHDGDDGDGNDGNDGNDNDNGKVERGWDWRGRFANTTISGSTSTSMSTAGGRRKSRSDGGSSGGGGTDNISTSTRTPGPGDRILAFLRRALARELPFAELFDQQQQQQQWGRGRGRGRGMGGGL